MHFELCKLMVYELNYILLSRSGETGVLCYISCCYVYMLVFHGPILAGGITKGIYPRMICFGWKESAIYSPRYAHFRKWLPDGQFMFIAVHYGQSGPFIAPDAPIPAGTRISALPQFGGAELDLCPGAPWRREFCDTGPLPGIEVRTLVYIGRYFSRCQPLDPSYAGIRILRFCLILRCSAFLLPGGPWRRSYAMQAPPSGFELAPTLIIAYIGWRVSPDVSR